MPMIYVDDSRDDKLCVFSALSIPFDKWRDCFDQVQEFRRKLNREQGLYVRREFHATELLGGRGHLRPEDMGNIGKGRRAEVFKDTLRVAAQLPGARLFNAVMHKKQDERAFEWLMNRIDKTCGVWGDNAILICDEGKQDAYTKLYRRMCVYNPIPSAYGLWQETGNVQKNIPLTHIIEDPFFKNSERSYFVQLADFCAFALLRLLNPTDKLTQFGIDQAFMILEPILVKEASSTDPLHLGIIGNNR